MGDGSHVCDILDPGFNSPVLCFPYPVMFTLLFNQVLHNLVAFFPFKITLNSFKLIIPECHDAGVLQNKRWISQQSPHC